MAEVVLTPLPLMLIFPRKGKLASTLLPPLRNPPNLHNSLSPKELFSALRGESLLTGLRLAHRFTRSFDLPTAVNENGISASYKDGVLTVTVPKAEEAKPKQIEVEVSG